MSRRSEAARQRLGLSGRSAAAKRQDAKRSAGKGPAANLKRIGRGVATELKGYVSGAKRVAKGEVTVKRAVSRAQRKGEKVGTGRIKRGK